MSRKFDRNLSRGFGGESTSSICQVSGVNGKRGNQILQLNVHTTQVPFTLFRRHDILAHRWMAAVDFQARYPRTTINRSKPIEYHCLNLKPMAHVSLCGIQPCACCLHVKHARR